MLVCPVGELGYVTFDVPGFPLWSGLGRGRFSAVYKCECSALPVGVGVMKVFTGMARDDAMSTIEVTVLTELYNKGVRVNIPRVVQHVETTTFNAIVLTPVGIPVLPCAYLVTPKMLMDLLTVLRTAHDLGWIHRDIKPDNIYLDQSHTDTIVLTDWSSAAKINQRRSFVGTQFFGDPPDEENMHTPSRAMDLRSFVRTVFCLSRQNQTGPADADGILRYWDTVQQQFPMFRKAMEFANNADYDRLGNLLVDMW